MVAGIVIASSRTHLPDRRSLTTLICMPELGVASSGRILRRRNCDLFTGSCMALRGAMQEAPALYSDQTHPKENWGID